MATFVNCVSALRSSRPPLHMSRHVIHGGALQAHLEPTHSLQFEVASLSFCVAITSTRVGQVPRRTDLEASPHRYRGMCTVSDQRQLQTASLVILSPPCCAFESAGCCGDRY